MIKVKRQRTADCVVGGFRYGKDSELVGSLAAGPL
jgi:ATP-dependent DNA ligase